MAQLPFFQSQDRVMQQLQTQWRALLNPVLSSPLTNPKIINNITLVSGINVINHGLQQTQAGWIITDQSAASSIYRSAPLNDINLTLSASSPCTISLVVY